MANKILFRSGNYAVSLDRHHDRLEISQLAPSSKCKCLDHHIGKTFPNTFDGSDDAVLACICMAAKSLKAGSGEKIVRLPKVLTK